MIVFACKGLDLSNLNSIQRPEFRIRPKLPLSLPLSLFLHLTFNDKAGLISSIKRLIKCKLKKKLARPRSTISVEFVLAITNSYFIRLFDLQHLHLAIQACNLQAIPQINILVFFSPGFFIFIFHDVFSVHFFTAPCTSTFKSWMHKYCQIHT